MAFQTPIANIDVYKGSFFPQTIRDWNALPDSFFGEQVNLETENRFVPLTKEKKDKSSPCGTNKSSFISGLKFISMNINSLRGKKLELLASLTFISHML